MIRLVLALTLLASPVNAFCIESPAISWEDRLMARLKLIACEVEESAQAVNDLQQELAQERAARIELEYRVQQLTEIVQRLQSAQGG